MAQVTLRPNANGFYPQFPVQVPNSGSHYDKVDDVTPDDLSTYIRTHQESGVEKRDSFLKAASGIPVGSTINSLRIYFRHRTFPTEGGVGAQGRSLLRSGGVDVFGAWVIDEIWLTEEELYITSPFTGLAWTIDEIDGMEIGVCGRSYYDNVFFSWAYEFCTQIYIVVDYTPPIVAAKEVVGDGLTFAGA